MVLYVTFIMTNPESLSWRVGGCPGGFIQVGCCLGNFVRGWGKIVDSRPTCLGNFIKVFFCTRIDINTTF